MTDETSPSARRPAWREPMVWLVAGIPALAVVGTVAMLVAAARAPGGNDAVADPVRRTAQVQVADIGADAQARALGLSAVLRTDGRAIHVLPVAGEFDRDAPLALALRHPLRAELDRGLVLHPSDTGWSGAAQVDASHAWIAQLGPESGRWRLSGRWMAGELAVYLRPALDEEK